MLDPKREEERLWNRAGRVEPRRPAEPIVERGAEPEPEPPPPEVSRWALLVPLVLGGLLGAAAFDNRDAVGLGTRLPTRTAEAARGPLERTIRLSGSIAARTASAIRA